MPDVRAGSPSGPPNKRAARKAQTRTRLLDSALARFDQDGYRATSIEAVAAGAGLSRVGFYLHFSGLADLAKELVKPALVELLGHYRLLDDLPSAPADLQRWSRSLIGVWRANAVRIRVGEYVVEVDPEMRGLWAAEMGDVAAVMPRYLDRWASSGRAGLGVLRLQSLLLAHERLCYLTMSTPAPVDEPNLVELISEQCWVLLCRDPGTTVPEFRPCPADEIAGVPA